MDKLLAGQITRVILAALAGIAVKWGIEVKDTSWVEALSVALAGGLLAAGALLWTRIRARVLLMTPAPDVTPPLVNLGATGGLDADNKPAKPLVLPLLFLPLLVALGAGAGCMGGHDFALQAPIHGSQVMSQLGTGTDEYHNAETALFDQAEATATDNLKTELAKYVLKVAAAGGTATVDQAKAAIAPAFTKYEGEKGKIDSDRRSEGTRYRNMLELLDYGKRIFAQIAEIEGLRYATYDQLRQMSKEFINQAVMTAAKPAAANGGGK